MGGQRLVRCWWERPCTSRWHPQRRAWTEMEVPGCWTAVMRRQRRRSNPHWPLTSNDAFCRNVGSQNVSKLFSKLKLLLLFTLLDRWTMRVFMFQCILPKYCKLCFIEERTRAFWQCIWPSIYYICSLQIGQDRVKIVTENIRRYAHMHKYCVATYNN